MSYFTKYRFAFFGPRVSIDATDKTPLKSYRIFHPVFRETAVQRRYGQGRLRPKAKKPINFGGVDGT
jgi:hypothetical protein